MAAIKKQSLVDQVYEKLRDDIIALRLPLGSKLNVNEMQESLGVSCTPIREAVNRLQLEGLVVYENNIGARVLSLDEHDVFEILYLTSTLHNAAVSLAMEKGDRGIILSELRECLDNYKKSDSVASQVAAISDFVGVFYHQCGNKRLDMSMISVQGQQHLLRHIYAAHGDGRDTNIQDFEAIIGAAERGEASEICALFLSNADRTVPTLLEYVASLS